MRVLYSLWALSEDAIKFEASEKGERTGNTFNGGLVSALIALFVSTRTVVESRRNDDRASRLN